MAKRNDTSKPRKDRDPAAACSTATSPTNADGLAPIFENTLEAAIEAERAQLMQAHAVLRCLYDVLLYADDEDSLLHADVVKLAAKLINDTVNQLDWLRLAPLVEKAKHEPTHKRSKPFEVRDLPVRHPMQLTREAVEHRLRRLLRELQARYAKVPESLGTANCDLHAPEIAAVSPPPIRELPKVADTLAAEHLPAAQFAPSQG